MIKMVNVLFVCLGNICRSPMAEAVFKHLIQNEKLEQYIQVDSAATSGWHIGNPPHRGTIAKLNEYNISTKGMAGRQLKEEDFEEFDYIVGMDENNIRDIRKMLGQPNHPKIIRFLDLTIHKKDVPDPYFTGDFQETYDLVIEGSEALLNKVKSDHKELLQS